MKFFFWRMYQISPMNWMFFFFYLFNLFMYMYMFMNNFDYKMFLQKNKFKMIYVK